MMDDLFPTPDRHDSGCKSVFKLPPGIIGTAAFRGERDEHRISLERFYEADLVKPDVPYALFIGMNPSGAEAHVNDLTIAKEWTWTTRFGFRLYRKMNVATYRWTDSRTIDIADVEGLIWRDNFSLIRSTARDAGLIVLSTGQPPDSFAQAARDLFAMLTEAGFALKCFGTTKAGWPKHTSRIAYATPLVDFVGMPA